MILPAPIPVVDMEAGDFAKDVEPDDRLLPVERGRRRYPADPLPRCVGSGKRIVVDVATRGSCPPSSRNSRQLASSPKEICCSRGREPPT